MEPIDVLLDTNVLIKIWRGDEQLEKEIDYLNCAIDTTVYLEFLQGAYKNQLTKTELFLKRFTLIPFTPGITFAAIKLIRKHSQTNGLRMPDALIAAASLENDLPLLTLNTQHFIFVEGYN